MKCSRVGTAALYIFFRALDEKKLYTKRKRRAGKNRKALIHITFAKKLVNSE